MTMQAAFVSAARALVGTRFRHQGRDPVLGVDCIGLVVLAARAIGADTSADRTDYPRVPTGVLLPILETAMTRVDDLQAGDVLVMRWGREPMHLAVWTGATLIHTYAQIGRVVEHGLDDRWRRRVVAAYRLKEFA